MVEPISLAEPPASSRFPCDWLQLLAHLPPGGAIPPGGHVTALLL